MEEFVWLMEERNSGGVSLWKENGSKSERKERFVEGEGVGTKDGRGGGDRGVVGGEGG